MNTKPYPFYPHDVIYYTGDVANKNGWFTISRVNPDSVDLKEIGGENRIFSGVYNESIGTQSWDGTCNPRFVTKRSHDDYISYRIRTYGTFGEE